MMKKSIKILICLLIALMVIPINTCMALSEEDARRYWNDILLYFKNRKIDIENEKWSIDILGDLGGDDDAEDIANTTYVEWYLGAKHISSFGTDSEKQKAKKVAEHLESKVESLKGTVYEEYKLYLLDYYRADTSYSKENVEYVLSKLESYEKTGVERVDNAISELKEEMLKILELKKITLSEKEDVDFWKPTNTGSSSNNRLIGKAGAILRVIQAVGSVVSVIALVIIGMKYMFASVEEKAKYKETLVPYIIGCVLVFATTTIASVIYEIAGKIFN